MANATDLEKKYDLAKIFVSYLLFERKQETQLSMAFALLAQERHNNLHTLGDHKTGDESDFGDCDNDKCKMAFAVLKDSRNMSIEVNDFTIQMVAQYNLTIHGSKGSARAWLSPKTETQVPKLIVPGGES